MSSYSLYEQLSYLVKLAQVHRELKLCLSKFSTEVTNEQNWNKIINSFCGK